MTGIILSDQVTLHIVACFPAFVAQVVGRPDPREAARYLDSFSWIL
jgi:hypothetical protein